MGVELIGYRCSVEVVIFVSMYKTSGGRLTANLAVSQVGVQDVEVERRKDAALTHCARKRICKAL